MQAICRKCQQLSEMPDYRVSDSCWICSPCRAAYERARSKTAAARKTSAAKFRRQLNDPTERPRILARVQTQKLVRTGKLVRQPCEVCGATKVEAHHEDYSRADLVRWLCPTHHREHHRNLKAVA